MALAVLPESTSNIRKWLPKMFQAGSTYQKEQTNVYEVQAMLSMMDVNCAEGWIQD